MGDGGPWHLALWVLQQQLKRHSYADGAISDEAWSDFSSDRQMDRPSKLREGWYGFLGGVGR